MTQKSRFQFAVPVDEALAGALLDGLAAEDLERQDALDGEPETWEPEAPADAGQDDPYPDWNASNSFVLSGPIGDAKFPGRRFGDWTEAQAHVTQTASGRGVRLYRFWTIPGRWFGRIGKVIGG